MYLTAELGGCLTKRPTQSMFFALVLAYYRGTWVTVSQALGQANMLFSSYFLPKQLRSNVFIKCLSLNKVFWGCCQVVKCGLFIKHSQLSSRLSKTTPKQLALEQQHPILGLFSVSSYDSDLLFCPVRKQSEIVIFLSQTHNELSKVLCIFFYNLNKLVDDIGNVCILRFNKEPSTSREEESINPCGIFLQTLILLLLTTEDRGHICLHIIHKQHLK